MNENYYCQQKVAQRGSDLYYSLLWIPAHERDAIISLYAFSREVQDIPLACSEISVARQKLAWWRIEIERLCAGLATHPVTLALHKYIPQYDLPMLPLQRLINTVEHHLQHTRFQDIQQLDKYRRALQQVEALAANVMQADSNVVQALNTVRYIVQHISQLRHYVQREFYPLPQENIQIDTSYTISEEMHQVLQSEATRAKEYYQQALNLITKDTIKSCLPFLIQSKLALYLLQEIAKDNYKVLQQQTQLTPLRKLWIAWRAKHTQSFI